MLFEAGVEGFWGIVAEAATVQTVVPRERWDVDVLYSVDAEPGRSYARFGAFIQVSKPDRVCPALQNNREAQPGTPFLIYLKFLGVKVMQASRLLRARAAPNAELLGEQAMTVFEPSAEQPLCAVTSRITNLSPASKIYGLQS